MSSSSGVAVDEPGRTSLQRQGQRQGPCRWAREGGEEARSEGSRAPLGLRLPCLPPSPWFSTGAGPPPGLGSTLDSVRLITPSQGSPGRKNPSRKIPASQLLECNKHLLCARPCPKLLTALGRTFDPLSVTPAGLGAQGEMERSRQTLLYKEEPKVQKGHRHVVTGRVTEAVRHLAEGCSSASPAVLHMAQLLPPACPPPHCVRPHYGPVSGAPSPPLLAGCSQRGA